MKTPITLLKPIKRSLNIYCQINLPIACWSKIAFYIYVVVAYKSFVRLCPQSSLEHLLIGQHKWAIKTDIYYVRYIRDSFTGFIYQLTIRPIIAIVNPVHKNNQFCTYLWYVKYVKLFNQKLQYQNMSMLWAKNRDICIKYVYSLQKCLKRFLKKKPIIDEVFIKWKNFSKWYFPNSLDYKMAIVLWGKRVKQTHHVIKLL